jgi:acyl-CoA dehydrogenase
MIDYAALDAAIGQNWYELDPELQRRVQADAPAEDQSWADDTLRRFGALVGGRLAGNADIVDRSPPELVRWDRWANEVDEVLHHPAALDSKAALWRTGYVSGFAADAAARGRSTPAVVLAGANYLLSQADTGMVCSLGMTSGVASLVEAYAPPDLRDRLLGSLRAADVADGADGSMFLTERDGGSDLGRTVHCRARDIGDGRALITGEKWFCSNIDGAAIVLLARPEGAPEGPAGLGLYLVPRELDDGTRNNITMRRLKPKLGTRSVPTGEVELHDALAYALRGRTDGATTDAGAAADAGGLARMMEMVNGSRFGVAMMGLGIARRSFLESAIWAHHRTAKGRLLVDLPLAREQLVGLLVELEAAFALGFECAAASRRDDGARLRRVLVPAAKVRLCRLGVEAASFAVEIHGGNGYCEDWGLTRQLRDAQCHPIWEGSENICALDVLRAIRNDRAHEALLARIDGCLDAARHAPPFTTEAAVAITMMRRKLARVIDEIPLVDPDRVEAGAARLTAMLVQTTSAALLLEQSVGDVRKGVVALQYARRHLAPRPVWDDRLASELGRSLLAYEQIDESRADKASAHN